MSIIDDGSWPADAAFPMPEEAPEAPSGIEGTQEPPVPAPPATQAPVPQDEVVEFDERHKEAFQGLLYLGRLERTFTFAGHEFTIRTLYTNETLEVGLLTQSYRGTLAEMKAYQAAVTAACVVSVDGEPMPLPITAEPGDTPASNKFRYVLRSWFPPVLDAVYEQYLLLEEDARKAMESLGKA